MDFKAKLDGIKEYFREVYMEAKRVTWPSKKDAVKGTYVVLITVAIASIFLGIVDVVFTCIYSRSKCLQLLVGDFLMYCLVFVVYSIIQMVIGYQLDEVLFDLINTLAEFTCDFLHRNDFISLDVLLKSF